MRKLKNEELYRKTISEFKDAKKTKLIVVLDNVRSLHNIGSIFRTADAFLSEAIYLCGITATPPNREIHKTALGSTETVNWVYYKETNEAINDLKTKGYTVYAIEQADKSIMLDNFILSANENIAIIFGNEIEGVAQSVVDLCDGVIEIPQLGFKHSMNVSVSVGIVIWELFKQLKKQSLLITN